MGLTLNDSTTAMEYRKKFGKKVAFHLFHRGTDGFLLTLTVSDYAPANQPPAVTQCDAYVLFLPFFPPSCADPSFAALLYASSLASSIPRCSLTLFFS